LFLHVEFSLYSSRTMPSWALSQPVVAGSEKSPRNVVIETVSPEEKAGHQSAWLRVAGGGSRNAITGAECAYRLQIGVLNAAAKELTLQPARRAEFARHAARHRLRENPLEANFIVSAVLECTCPWGWARWWSFRESGVTLRTRPVVDRRAAKPTTTACPAGFRPGSAC
jgi:hypothetical protein